MASPAKIMEGRWKGAPVFRDGGGGILINGQQVVHLVRGYDVADVGRKVASGVAGAAAGTVLLGPIGLAGGLLAARKKRTAVITWDNGEQSLIEVSNGFLHKDLLAAAFRNGGAG